jgi:hypothetical protein
VETATERHFSRAFCFSVTGVKTRLVRALAALLIVATIAPALSVLASSPAAAAQPTQVTKVESRVTPTTPMWVVDFIVTFNGPIDCSGGPQSVNLHYLVSTNDNGSPGGGTTGVAPACIKDADLAANQAVIHFDLIGRGSDAFVPSEYLDLLGTGVYTLNLSTVWVQAKLALASAPAPNLETAPLRGPAELPTAPVWIGMGDGYSSQLVQTPDTCITADTCYAPNDVNSSWIGKAAEDINTARVAANNVNARWSLTPVVVARDGATSADVASGTQNTQMRAELGRRIIPRLLNSYGPLSSWNWVSVSAGLVDSGIPNIMRAYSAGTNGAATGGRFPYNVPTNPTPWDVPAGNPANCPDLGNTAGTTGVIGTINGSAGDAIIPNLTTMVRTATDIDSSVHVVQVLYPYLTEPSNPCASDHGTFASNRTVMARLRTKSDITANPNDNVVALDLMDATKGFGDVPTGTAPARTDSRLWLSRPFGYPYPSRTGITAMKNAATVIVGSAAADVLPPEVVGYPVEPSATTGGQWWNLPTVHIQWSADDASGLDGPSTAVWRPVGPTSTATTEGTVVYDSPQACDVNGRCAAGHVPLSIDYSAPYDAVVTDREPDHNGWYNADGGPVTLTWYADDTKYVDADRTQLALDAFGNPIATSGVRPETVPDAITVTTSSGSPQSFGDANSFICDFATNCVTQATTSVNVDLVDPTLTNQLTSTDTTPQSGWYQSPVAVAWATADAESGVDASTSDLQSGTVTRGTQTFVGTVCDIAGNCVVRTYTAQVDGEAPVVSFVGGAVQGDTYPTNGVPTVTCAADDQPDLSGVAASGCTVTLVKGTADASGKALWTYTANAKDVAGNAAVPATLSFYVQGSTAPPETTDGRMTGEGEFKSTKYGTTEVDLSIRCTGTASNLSVQWGSSAFELDTVTSVSCKDDPAIDGPGPFTTLSMTGTGTYCKGGEFEDADYHESNDHRGGWWNERRGSDYRHSGYLAATYSGETSHHGGCTSYPGQTLTCVTGSITVTFVDAGSGKTDTANIVIKDNTGKVVFSGSAKLVDGNWVTGPADGGTSVDTIAPTVTPKLTSTYSPSNGWYRSKVTVSWTTADNVGGSGLVTSTPPPAVVVTASGTTIVKSASVCDKAGNCSIGQVEVKIDATPPTVDITGATNGASYTSRPDVECTAADQLTLSGLAGPCTLSFTSSPTYGGTSYTYTATATDKAGNTTSKTVTFKVIAAPTSTGRMTGGGTIRSTGVNTSFTLRCSGSPNNLDVFTGDLRFTLLNVTSVACSDDPAFSPASPGAPIDTFTGTGTGKLSDGRSATIAWTFTDHGEPGVHDTATIVIKVGSTTVLSASGTLSSGNFQAHASQGNGTNNNGNVNGPNGHGDYSGAGWHWTDSQGDHTVNYDDEGCHYRVETSSRVRYEDDDRQGNRSKYERKKSSSSHWWH